MTTDNAYLAEFRKHERLEEFAVERFTERTRLTALYAWAVPTAEAVRALVRLSPLVEVGAGTGYWASLVRAAGGVVHPFDCDPPTSGVNHWGHREEYVPVLRGGPEVLAGFDEACALFLCWPPYDTTMALDCLRAFRGTRVAYVGEDRGCCATEEFFDEFDTWPLVRRVKIPQHAGIHDEMVVRRRP